MLCIMYKSWIVTAFNLLLLTQKQSVPSFLRTRTVGGANSVCVGSMKSMESTRFISCFLNSLASGPTQYGAEWTGRLYAISISIWCSKDLFKPSCPSRMVLNCVGMLMNMSLYAECSSGRVRSSHQIVFKILSNCFASLRNQLASHGARAAYIGLH